MQRAIHVLAATTLLGVSAASPLGILQALEVESLPRGVFVRGVQCRSDSSQTYSLYLPRGFAPERRWPALIVFDPRGRSIEAAERFRDAAETYGWLILSSDGSRSDGPWEPNRRALEALWPEVHGRYPIDPHRVYAAGFSGGAIVAWYLAQFGTPPLAGVIASGGRMAREIPTGSIDFAHFGAVGRADFNYSEMKRLDELVAERGAPHQFRVFPGRHQWLPPDLAFESIEWMEVLAMQQGRRPRDPRLVDSLFAKDVAAAARLVAEGNNLAALWRYATIVRTWQGLKDVKPVQEAQESLRADPVTQRLLEADRRTDEFETEQILRHSRLLGDDRSLRGSTFEGLWGELQLDDLLALAANQSDSARAAQRVLEWIFTRSSFYLARERLLQGRDEETLLLLRVALGIHPEAPGVWFDLARTEARLGDKDAAYTALHHAVDRGYRDLARLDSDPDLAILRGTPQYQEIHTRLQDGLAEPNPH